MDRYCPECNSTMTPSLVGYLCVNCGHVQRFYSAGEAALATPKTPMISTKSTEGNEKKAELPTKNPKSKPRHSKNKVKTTLKRLMVPELAPPHPHLIGDGDDNITPVLSDKIEDEQVMPAMLVSDSPNTESSPDKTPKTDTPTDTEEHIEVSSNDLTPNQSSNLSELQSALHPQKNTSIWIMLGLALLMLIVAAAVLFLIILS